MAAQLIGTYGAARRGDSSCIVRATSSLPVPLSPVITTEADECAKRSMAVITRRIASERPKSGPIPTASASRGRGLTFSLRTLRLSTILVSITRSPLKLIGTPASLVIRKICLV